MEPFVVCTVLHLPYCLESRNIKSRKNSLHINREGKNTRVSYFSNLRHTFSTVTGSHFQKVVRSWM